MGAPTTKGGCHINVLANFPRKLRENKEHWPLKKWVLGTPVDLLLTWFSVSSSNQHLDMMNFMN